MKYPGKMFIIVLLLCNTAVSFAQFSGTTWEQRLGTGKDSIEARKLYISIFNDYITPRREYNDSTYMIWRKMLGHAPYVDYYFYSSGWMESFLIPQIPKSLRPWLFKPLMM